MVWVLAVLAPPAAHGALRGEAAVVTDAGATRLVVTLTSTKKVPARERPRKVVVKAGGRKYKLKRASGARAAAVSLGTWRSRAYRGAKAAKLRKLAGKRVKVRVRTRAGTRSVRPRVTAPADEAPTGPAPPADPGTPPADPGPAPPAGGDPAVITGQEAIDRMTAELRDGMVKRFHTSGDLSETYELHLCGDGAFRYYHHQSYIGFGPLATEKLGSPWTVVEAQINTDGSYRGARVRGTFTHQNSSDSGPSAINEPAEALIEFSGGSWYWDKQLVATGTASCAPVL